MLRYGLLGGTRPPMPWEFFVTLGGALCLAAGLFALLFPLWSTYPGLGLGEAGTFLLAGAILLGMGFRRRRQDRQRPRDPRRLQNLS